jgi:hypothetical protein
MHWDEVEKFAAGLPGVHAGCKDGLRSWRMRGRLVARQLDADSLVIRVSFDLRPALLSQFPGTFSVPRRLEKHMSVLADLIHAEPGAIEQALEGAWRVQSRT